MKAVRSGAREVFRVPNSRFVGDENHTLLRVRGKTYVALFTNVGIPDDSVGHFQPWPVDGVIRLRRTLKGDRAVGIAIHEFLHAINYRWSEKTVKAWTYELQDLLADAIDAKDRKAACRLVRKWMAAHKCFRPGDSRDLVAFLWSAVVQARTRKDAG